MKQVTRCEFGGGLSEVSLNRLIIKLIKKNIRTPSGSLKKTRKKLNINDLRIFSLLQLHHICTTKAYGQGL